MRVLITGGPKTGKTTLSTSYTGPIHHTDDLIKLQWDDQSTEVVQWLDRPGPWCIEGVAVVRSLRKWLRSHPSGLPFDHLIYLTKPLIERSYGQVLMATSTRTIWNQISDELVRRAVDHATIEMR